MVIKKSQQYAGLESNYLTSESFQGASLWVIEQCDLQGMEGNEDPPAECEYGSAMVLPVVSSKENKLVCNSSVHLENDY